ncbi:unnamed protein product, partial [Laminaria digitata]
MCVYVRVAKIRVAMVRYLKYYFVYWYLWYFVRMFLSFFVFCSCWVALKEAEYITSRYQVYSLSSQRGLVIAPGEFHLVRQAATALLQPQRAGYRLLAVFALLTLFTSEY